MRRRAATAIGLLTALVAIVCGVLGVVAVNALQHSGPALAVLAAGGSAGSGQGAAAGPLGSAVTAPGAAAVAAPDATQAVEVTPLRNPPLMAQGSAGEDIRGLQVRLAHLGLFDADVTGYFGPVTAGAVRAYQTASGLEPTAEIYQELWTALQDATPTPTEDELYPPPPDVEPPTVPVGSLDPRCATGRVLCIDKTESVLRWVVQGRVLLELDARFGRPGMETDEGQFSVYWKDVDHISSIYESEMPFSMFFSGGQAVHYSADFAAAGYNGASHGCVNIRDRDNLAWLFDQVDVGDKVVIYWS